MSDWPVHPAAACFPALPQPEYLELVADIALHGLHNAIGLWKSPDGVVYLVDGRHRLKACRELGIEPTTEFWEDADVANRVIAANLLRRHLDVAARVALALAAVQAAEKFEKTLSDNVFAPKRREGRPLGTVARVAKLARCSRQAAYQHVPRETFASHKPPSLPDCQKSLAPDEITLLKVLRLLESIDGRDIADHGVTYLARITEHCRRIKREHDEDVAVTAGASAAPQLATV